MPELPPVTMATGMDGSLPGGRRRQAGRPG
jgi:hypothetical protein